jgi:hypothetical protein
VQIVLILLGLLLAFNQEIGVFGWLLLIAGIISHFVFKSISNKSAQKLSDKWMSLFAAFSAIFGEAETLHTPASGIYKEVDDLYLRSLDSQRRASELQMRQMQKQMDAQNEQHQATMQAMEEQRKQMRQMNDTLLSNSR